MSRIEPNESDNLHDGWLIDFNDGGRPVYFQKSVDYEGDYVVDVAKRAYARGLADALSQKSKE